MKNNENENRYNNMKAVMKTVEFSALEIGCISLFATTKRSDEHLRIVL